MWLDRVSNPGPLTYESGALPPALRDPAVRGQKLNSRVAPTESDPIFVKLILSYSIDNYDLYQIVFA